MKLKIFLCLLPLLTFAQIPNYYHTVNFNTSGDVLKNQLTTLITTTHTTSLPYTSGGTDVWDALRLTDQDPDDSNNIFLIYGWDDADEDGTNDRTRGKYATCHTTSCNGLWVREHVYPRSLGTPNLGFEDAGSDAHHLRAIDYSLNNSRSNRKFDNGNGHASVLSNGNFYPGDEYKGDVARMMMYSYLRYPTQCLPKNVGVGSTSYSNYGDMLNLFLDWNIEDPVSEYELNRNNILQNLQGNRNPFIDNPYLATLIWNGQQAPDNWHALTLIKQEEKVVFLYPTCTKDFIYFNNSSHLTYKYTVINALGQVLSKNNTEGTIDLSGNADGIYYIKLENNNTITTHKILLNAWKS